MGIQAAEISAILKDQIKNFGKKPKLPKLAACCPSVTELRVFTGWTMFKPVRWLNFPAAFAGWR